MGEAGALPAGYPGRRMDLSIETIATLSPALVRRGLAAWIAHHWDAAGHEQVVLEGRIQSLIDVATDSDIIAMRGAFRAAGEGWQLFAANPLARGVTRTYMSALTQPWSLEGESRLLAFSSRPGRKLVVCNHLSYTDTQVTDAVLALAGHQDFANRLVAIAGPKVYTEAWRRMASIALNTRKTAQSSAVASEQDSMSPRELAVVAIETLRECGRLMDEGYVVLLYPEGTRSRDTKLQPFLRAAARYLAIDGLSVLPLAQTGGERLFPIDAPRMYRGEVRLAFGEAFLPADHPGKTGALEEAHRRLNVELPRSYKGNGPAVG